MKIKNKLKPKIFWVGPYIPSKYLRYWLAASPAAMKWQSHLYKSLINENIDMEWLYYRPDSYWPKGRLMPYSKSIPSEIVNPQNQIHYLNAPGLRNFTLKESLEKILINKFKQYISRPLVIVSYNGPAWMKQIFSNQNIRSKFSCIYIVADEEVPPSADGYVFLSYDSFKKYKKNLNKLHLDGAIYPLIESKNSQKLYKKKKLFFFILDHFLNLQELKYF